MLVTYFMKFRLEPAQVEGDRLELWSDDGSREWSNLFERAGIEPVRDGRQNR